MLDARVDRHDSAGRDGAPAAAQRARGSLRLGFRGADGRTRLADLYQAGALKALFPRGDGDPEAVVLNTAGGLTGGDQMDLKLDLAPAARATLTTQACERIYRSAGGDARVSAAVGLGAGARLGWLPQPTILFDGGRLARRLDIDMAADATLTAVETVILGRAAMGEAVARGALTDRWRVRRAGRLVWADTLRLGPDWAALGNPALLGPARAMASLIHVAPDAEAALPGLRATLTLHGAVTAGASAWNGLVACRLVSDDAQPLLAALAAILTTLRGAPPPAVWRL